MGRQAKPSPDRLTKLSGQLAALKANYGSTGASSSGVTIDDMNQVFSGPEIDALVDEITANLSIALQLCEDAEKTRYRSTEPRGLGRTRRNSAAQADRAKEKMKR